MRPKNEFPIWGLDKTLSSSSLYDSLYFKIKKCQIPGIYKSIKQQLQDIKPLAPENYKLQLLGNLIGKCWF